LSLPISAPLIRKIYQKSPPLFPGKSNAGIASADVILNALARRQQTTPPPPIFTPERLILAIAPLADCARYDRLRATEARHGAL
jgi:hypothetical protein